MSRKKQESSLLENNPFRSQLQQISAQKKASQDILPQTSGISEGMESSPVQKPKELSEEDLFWQAMMDVEPFAEEYPVPMPALQQARSFPSPEEQVRQELEKLVAGDVEFDMSQHEEFIEGAVHGLDPRVVQRLRRGEFSWQAHLDLHGCRVEEARVILEHFIVEQRRKHHRCLLIVHGRGLHSPDKEPVLKQQVVRWLTRGFLRKQVLAFVTARPQDGGPGALYVLLRRL